MLIGETHLSDRFYVKTPSYSIYQTIHPDNTAHAMGLEWNKESISYCKWIDIYVTDIDTNTNQKSLLYREE